MSWQNELLAFLLGIAAAFLGAAIQNVAEPWYRRWRVRRAIEYTAVARHMNAQWPGAPGCICWPGDDRLPRCAGAKHRSKTPKK